MESDRFFRTGPESIDCHLVLDADEFVTKYELDDLRNEIRTGAFLVNDPDHAGCLESLSDAEIRALALEKQPTPIFSRTIVNWFWSFPCVCTIGGLLWGLVEVSSLQLAAGRDFPNESRPSARYSAALTGLYAEWVAAMVGCWCAIPLLKYFGHRGAVYFVVALRLAGLFGASIFSASSLDTIADAVAVVAGGMFSCIVPMYLVETSPVSMRGSMFIAWQLSQGTGSWIRAQLASSGVDLSTDGYWLFTLSLLGVAACFWVSPESPYWHARKGGMRQAYNALIKCRGNALQASRDLYSMYLCKVSRSRCATQRHVLQAAAIAAALLLSMIIPETSATLVLLSITDMADYNPTALVSKLMTPMLVSGATMLCLLPLSINLIERTGRRGLIMASMVFISLILFGSMLSAPAEPVMDAESYLAIPLMLIAPSGLQVTVWQLYAAEVSCSVGCEAAMAAAMTLSTLRDICATYSAVKIVERTHGKLAWAFPNYCLAAPLSLFFALHFVFMVLLGLVLLETRRCTLDEIRFALDVPIANRVAYRIRIYTPYIFKRLFLRQHVEPEPFEQSQYGTGAIHL
ncbi:hypothetical protein BDW68DRAFT_58066 [Aspergillus falconensis]